ncbi:MAG TPA: RCC1 domain-containing protein [Candidatus Wunengus californicus]|uniref:RCC1 domain-containing protein n=1 Tax=Candidatus Wunengus californicus TaxID=3367619 RepID=UPI00402A47F3
MRNTFLNLLHNKFNVLSIITTLLFLPIIHIVGDASASTIPQVSAGGFHTAAIKSIGTVWTWGNNTYGQLGNGTNNDSNTPIQVSGISDVVDIASGYWHTVALESDGTVWTWGNNTYGQLGDGTNTDRNTPVQVDGISNVIAIACGYWHSIALKSDGTVWAWGNNFYGQLGDGSNANSVTPVQVKNNDGSILSDVIAIACGYWHSIALKQDASVWTWGNNTYGQLGDATNVDKTTPVEVNGLSNDVDVNVDIVKSIAGGHWHSLALKSNGTVWAWGNNTYGQLGDGSNTDSNTAVEVKFGGTTEGIDNFFTTSQASTKAPTESDHATPPKLESSLRNIITIASGGGHTVFLRSDGAVLTCGSNYGGQLGDGTDADSNIPVLVDNLSGVITSVAGGLSHTVVLRSDGMIWTWGINYNGQLGDGTYDQRSTPVQVKYINLIQTTSSIYGHVIDAVDGNYLTEVSLTLRGKKTKIPKITSSDEEGFFQFENLESDTYIIKPKKEGYKVYNIKPVTLKTGEAEEIEIKMKPKKNKSNSFTNTAYSPSP